MILHHLVIVKRCVNSGQTVGISTLRKNRIVAFRKAVDNFIRKKDVRKNRTSKNNSEKRVGVQIVPYLIVLPTPGKR